MKPYRFVRLTTISTLLCLVLLCAACTVPTPNAPAASEAAPASSDETRFPLTITDAAGQEFTFDAPPKIGCLWTGCTEVLADLGVAPYAGDSWLEEVYASVLFFPAGPPAHTIADAYNPEDWAAAEVDLILMRLPVTPDVEPLTAAAPIFYLHAPSFDATSVHGYQAYLENIRLVGQLIDQPAVAEAAIARFEDLIAGLHHLSTPATAARSVAILWEDEAFHAVDNTNPFCVVIQEAGLGNCIEAPLWEEINPEAFLALDPDLILVMQETDAFAERTNPVWAQLSAVKNGKVYGVSGLYYCCGARALAYDLHEYAHLILPEVVAAPGPTADYDPAHSPFLDAGAAPAATGAPATTGTRTVTHDLGVTEVPVNPQRIVAINSASIELLATLGIKPVGIAPWIGAGNPVAVAPHISAAMDLTDVTLVGDANQPNLEAIAALNPDLILMSGGGYYQEMYDQVSQIAPTVAYAAWPEGSPRSYWKEFFISTATAMGKATEAQVVIDAWQARITAFTAAAAVDETELSVIRLMPDSIMAYQKGSYSGTVLEDVGVKQVESQEVVDFAIDLSMEQIPMLDGDILLLIQSDPNAAIYTQLLASPLWQQLGAVQAGKVYLVNTDIWIGGDGYISANLILDDLERLFLEDGAGMTKAERD